MCLCLTISGDPRGRSRPRSCRSAPFRSLLLRGRQAVYRPLRISYLPWRDWLAKLFVPRLRARSTAPWLARRPKRRRNPNPNQTTRKISAPLRNRPLTRSRPERKSFSKSGLSAIREFDYDLWIAAILSPPRTNKHGESNAEEFRKELILDRHCV